MVGINLTCLTYPYCVLLYVSGQSDFKNVARRATHTILALSGIAHNEDFVVSTPHPLPSHCNHACDGQEPAFLMRTCCSSCFNSFVGGVVSYIAEMFT